MRQPREPRPEGKRIANDNARKRRAPVRLPRAELKLPEVMGVQLVEVEVLADLLESLPPIANDNGDGQ